MGDAVDPQGHGVVHRAPQHRLGPEKTFILTLDVIDGWIKPLKIIAVRGPVAVIDLCMRPGDERISIEHQLEGSHHDQGRLQQPAAGDGKRSFPLKGIIGAAAAFLQGQHQQGITDQAGVA